VSGIEAKRDCREKVCRVNRVTDKAVGSAGNEYLRRLNGKSLARFDVSVLAVRIKKRQRAKRQRIPPSTRKPIDGQLAEKPMYMAPAQVRKIAGNKTTWRGDRLGDERKP
jgi:hypothetical protein